MENEIKPDFVLDQQACKNGVKSNQTYVVIRDEAFNGNGTYHITDQKNLWYDILGYDYIYYAFLYTKEAINLGI